VQQRRIAEQDISHSFCTGDTHEIIVDCEVRESRIDEHLISESTCARVAHVVGPEGKGGESGVDCELAYVGCQCVWVCAWVGLCVRVGERESVCV